MSSSFKAAVLQLNSGANFDANINAASMLARDARKVGAEIVFMPENVAMMSWGKENIHAAAMPEETHKALAAFRELAKESGLWIHCGSLAVRLADGGVVNRSYLLDPKGQTAAFYDKIHMFDVDLGNGESYWESETFTPGSKAVLAPTPWGDIGMSICYDLRFPHLYRQLAQAGASFLAIPAAFTRTTGRAHWHVLMRARAIETGCYIFASTQCGEHFGRRQTFGHALIVSPWGDIIADGGEQPGFIMAVINPDEVALARKRLPSLTHDRPFSAP